MNGEDLVQPTLAELKTEDVKPEGEPMALAESRRAAEKAWTAADEWLGSFGVWLADAPLVWLRLFEAAKIETTRDSVERVQRAVLQARQHKASGVGGEPG